MRKLEVKNFDLNTKTVEFSDEMVVNRNSQEACNASAFPW